MAKTEALDSKELDLTIEGLGGLYFTPLEIAIILEKDIAEFLVEFGYHDFEALQMAKNYNQHTEIFKKVQKGRLLQKAQLRHRIFEQALAGSAPAQKEMMEIIEMSEIQEMLAKI